MIQSVVALQKDAFKIRWFSVPIVRLGVVQMSFVHGFMFFFAWILAPTTRTDDGRRRQRTTTTADDDDKQRRQTMTTDGRQPTVPSRGGCSLASVVVLVRCRLCCSPSCRRLPNQTGATGTCAIKSSTQTERGRTEPAARLLWSATCSKPTLSHSLRGIHEYYEEDALRNSCMISVKDFQ